MLQVYHIGQKLKQRSRSYDQEIEQQEHQDINQYTKQSKGENSMERMDQLLEERENGQ